MKYRRFGKTELKLSVFSLGLMRCCYGENQLFETVQKAIALGINHFEMARAYGQSEKYFGSAVKQLDVSRDKLIITTKFVPTANPQIMEQNLEESLLNLQVDYLDCVAIHGINTWEHLELLTQKNSCLKILQEAKKQGIIKHIGFSTHGDLELIKATIKTNQFEFINLHYYYFWQRNGTILDLAQQDDLGVFIISPVDKGGQLHQPSSQLTTLCEPFTPLYLNYRFLLSDRRISTLSLGASNPDELTIPLSVADNDEKLNSLEMAALDRINSRLRDTLKTEQCSQCYQCLPCPENINIPEILRLRNLGVGLDMSEYASYRYQMLENAGHWFWGKKGDKCTNCGECLPKCPENLNIPKLLEDSHNRYNASSRRRLWE